jgi:hypothetical protein
MTSEPAGTASIVARHYPLFLGGWNKPQGSVQNFHIAYFLRIQELSGGSLDIGHLHFFSWICSSQNNRGRLGYERCNRIASETYRGG